ncbi:hypothetical protein CSA17_02290 [bacterium DOLJORAL78_65_58]|nr:MAG: hypothetical protein CSB20_05115 [bacterium DOLZORAL124_64_63]PIE76428.1 MAG: hypothetical protein CSA17_02290 [bacterium DOLJORAL78_65_58]
MLLMLLTGMALGATPAWAEDTPANALVDPIISMDSQYKFELDLGMVVDDLRPRLMAMLMEKDPEEAEALQLVLDVIGIEALQRLKIEGKDSKEHSKFKARLTMDPRHRDSLLFQLYTSPNGKCRFAKLLDRQDLALFMTAHNFAHIMELALDFLKRDDIAQLLGPMPINEDGNLDLDGFVPRTDLLPLLSGELDFFIFSTPEDAQFNLMAMPFGMALGSTDGFALRNTLLDLLGDMSGDAAGLRDMLAQIEPEMVGDFELQATPFGLTIATSQDFLVLSMEAEHLRPVLAGEASGMKVPDGLKYAYINGEQYGKLMGDLMSLSAMMGESNSDLWLLGFYEDLFQYLETEEMLYRSSGSNAFEAEAEVRGAVITGLYQMLPNLIDNLPQIIEERAEDFGYEDFGYEDAEGAEDDPSLEWYQDIINTMDQAMMLWAADHDGTYPEHPLLLFQEDYLSEWPFTTETRPGTYVDRGFSYHSYHDENNRITGYLFVLYGGDPVSGYDIYTPENTVSKDPFVMDADGIPDGVIGFCYDGTAQHMVDQYLSY